LTNQLLKRHEELQSLFLKNKADVWHHVEEELIAARTKENKVAEYKFLYLAGIIFSSKGQYFQALSYLEEAKHICETADNDADTLARIYNSIGIIYKRQDKPNEALNYFLISLKYDSIEVTPQIYNNLSTIYLAKKEYEKAEFYLNKVISYPHSIEKDDLQISCYINMGIVKFYKGEIEESLKTFQKAFFLSEHHQMFHKKSHCLHNIACIYEHQEDYPKAIAAFEEANDLAVKYDFPLEVVRNQFSIANINFKHLDFQKGILQFKALIEHCEESELVHWKIKILKILKTQAESEKDFEQAYHYASSLILLQSQIIKDSEQKAYYDLLETKEKEILTLREKNEQIEIQNKKLANSNKELKQYAHIVAHDLKEPLRGICSFSDLLMRRHGNDLSGDARDFLSYISKGATHMNELLEDLLKYASLVKDHSNIGMINIQDIVVQTVGNLSDEIKKHNIQISINPLPIIKGDEGQLQMVFENLITNAIKFRHPSRRSSIVVGYENDIKEHVFFVKDNGIGVDKDYQQKIFNIFQRLDKRNYEGTGIGLAVCEKIADLHNGKIWLSSELGVGSTFYFSVGKSSTGF
jgi:signal transduction histidine kinase/Tfp pilus assembly protein PilF